MTAPDALPESTSAAAAAFTSGQEARIREIAKQRPHLRLEALRLAQADREPSGFQRPADEVVARAGIYLSFLLEPAPTSIGAEP